MNKNLAYLLILISFSFACAEEITDTPNSEALDDPTLISVDTILDGSPENSELRSEAKADEIFPVRSSELVKTQSSVKSQGSRGVCSIFSTVAYMEHLYITEGTITDPDFSEQYLQWSAKFEVGAFKKTGGSNANRNIEAIHRFGIPSEDAWTYESAGWNTSDDPECKSDDKDKPTRCYTNGTPPEEALQAAKFSLPAGRFISTRARDIKARIHTKKQAVVVGLTFFYQSWNHRRSPLKVNSDYWDQGYVLYPNADDKKHGLEKKAGHSILIVGWDDELEVPTVDKDGNVIKDSNGDPIVEKGFFLFKNSWGTGGFGSKNEKGDGYGWLSMKYVKEFGRGRISDLPKLEVPDEICGDNIDNDRNGDTDCDDVACENDSTCVQENEVIEVVSSALSIPDNDAKGAQSTFQIELNAVSSMVLDIDIKHSFAGDLSIELVSPAGEVIEVLAADSGNATDDLVQSLIVKDADKIATQGEWTLRVIDHAAVDTGEVRSARLTITP